VQIWNKVFALFIELVEQLTSKSNGYLC